MTFLHQNHKQKAMQIQSQSETMSMQKDTKTALPRHINTVCWRKTL